MRLISLTIRNFRVMKAVDLNFEDNVIGIIGPNGAGKSTIVEAISWALYGNQAARSGKEEIKSTFARPDETCEVTFDFLINEEKYRVVRRLVGKSERAEVELYRGESAESVGVSETQRYIGELLGLDWRGFLTSFLARQQELNALSMLQPAKRKDHLAGMLGIERLDKAISRVKEDVKVAAGQALVLERQLGEIDQIKATIDELGKRREQLAGSVAKQEKVLAESKKSLETARTAFATFQESKAAYSELTARLEAAEQSRDDLIEREKELTAESESLKKAEKEAAGLREKTKELDSARETLEKLKKAESQKRWIQQLVEQTNRLEKEKKAVQGRLETTQKSLKELDSQLAALPESVESVLKEERVKLEAAREQYSAVQAERRSLEVQQEKLTAQMASIAKLGPDSVCDRCLRPLGDDLPQIQGHLHAEKAELDKRAGQLDTKLSEAKAAGTRLRVSVDDLDQKVTRRRELVMQRQSAVKECETGEKQLGEIQQRRQEVSRQLSEAGEVRFDPGQLEAAQKQVAELEDAKSRLDRIEGSLARRDRVAAEIERILKARNKANEQAADLEKRRGELAFSEAAFSAAKEAFERAQQGFEAAREHSVAATKEFELTEKELQGKNEQLTRLEKSRTELDSHRSDQYYGEKLTGLLTEFKARLIARIRPTLADFSSRLMSEMTDGRYTMVELDEKYNLRVLDAGQYFGVERFSGGEKDLANLCLRLAISQALIDSAGMSRSFIILDEVFGSQDDERKDLIIRALTNLKHRFPQILLITHVGDIKDRVESLIEIEPTGYGWSRVSVNGTPV